MVDIFSWGYFGMEEKTKETIDDEGWLHSGDIGNIDKVRFVIIIHLHLA